MEMSIAIYDKIHMYLWISLCYYLERREGQKCSFFLWWKSFL